MGSKRHTILLTKIFTFTIKKYNNNLNAHNSSDSGSCLPGGFSNTLGRMLADSGNRQMLDCLPLLTLGKMLQEKMVHQSEALWALGSKAEKWGRGDCASSHFHCCMMGKLPFFPATTEQKYWWIILHYTFFVQSKALVIVKEVCFSLWVKKKKES